MCVYTLNLASMLPCEFLDLAYAGIVTSIGKPYG
jgi:hypothetical protein